jgi:hypothetical protein
VKQCHVGLMLARLNDDKLTFFVSLSTSHELSEEG